MLIIFNGIGLGMAVVGAAIALVVARLTPPDLHGPAALALGAVWVIGDIAFRWRSGKRRFLHYETGGQLFFVPMWAWGILCLFLSARMLRTSIQQRHEDQAYREHVVRRHDAQK